LRRALKAKSGVFLPRAVGSGVVVVGAKCVQLQLEVGRRVCRRLLGQELLEGLVEALDLAAGLGMVGRGVLALDAESVQFRLQQHLALTRPAGEDSAVVGEQGGGVAELLSGFVEDLDDVWALDSGKGDRGEKEAGVVVLEVEDLGIAAVRQGPVGGVGLPHLVGQLRLEADEGGPGPLVGLGG
jgi:hypothetical protein